MGACGPVCVELFVLGGTVEETIMTHRSAWSGASEKSSISGNRNNHFNVSLSFGTCDHTVPPCMCTLEIV